MVKPISLRFDDTSVRKARPSVYIVKAAAAYLHAFATKTTPANAANGMYGHDSATEMVLRASTSPAEIGTTGWATELAQHGVRDLIASITSVSAGAALLDRAVKVDMGSYAQLRIPGRVLDVNSAGTWVAEGAPITVRQLVTTQGAVLQPHRLIVLTSWSRELAEHSLIEDVVRQALSEALGLALDGALFSTNADDGVHPGGLLYNVTPVAAAGRLQRDIDTAAQDIANLTADLASRGAGLAPVLVCNVKQCQTCACSCTNVEQICLSVLPTNPSGLSANSCRPVLSTRPAKRSAAKKPSEFACRWYVIKTSGN
jgi:hypothetical protein